MKSPHRYLTLATLVALGSFQNLQGSTVSNSGDSGPGSLRNAIASAVNGETINFDPALDGATITLSSGHLLIGNLAITIDAASLPAGLSLSGNNLQRVLAVSGSSDVTLKSLTIRNGRAIDNNGGGIFLSGGNLNMLDCTVRDCSSTYNGGAVFLSFGVTSTFERCSMVGNSTGNLGFGGALFVSGASTTLLRSCVISGNSSLYGGGFYIANSSPTLINCTVQGNSGGGFRNESNGDPDIENTIVWGNTTSGNLASQQFTNLTGSNPAISYSVVQGASSSASFADGDAVNWGSGNLNGELPASDPKFAAAVSAASAPHAGGDLRLLANSPALNTGNNLAVIGTFDLARSARIQNTTVDLGAYEGYVVTFTTLFPALAPGDDANHNGVSNFQEYAMGFDPTVPNPQVSPLLTSSGGFTFLTLNQRTNALDFSTSLLTSVGLISWNEMIDGIDYNLESSTSASSDRRVLVLRLNHTDPKRFYRQAFTP